MYGRCCGHRRENGQTRPHPRAQVGSLHSVPPRRDVPENSQHRYHRPHHVGVPQNDVHEGLRRRCPPQEVHCSESVKDAIMCANVAGFGNTISQASHPRTGSSIASADACSSFCANGKSCIKRACVWTSLVLVFVLVRFFRDVFFTLSLRTLL